MFAENVWFRIDGRARCHFIQLMFKGCILHKYICYVHMYFVNIYIYIYMFLPTKYVTHIFQLRLFQTSFFREPWKIIQKALSHGFLDQSRPCTYTGRVVTFLSSNSAAWRWCKRIARKVDKRIMLKCTTVCKRVRKLIIHFVFKWTSTIINTKFQTNMLEKQTNGSMFSNISPSTGTFI